MSFAAACASVSVATIRRAEQGHRIYQSALSRIAEVLKQPVEKYIATAPTGQSYSVPNDISGSWFGFFVEIDIGGPPYIVETEVSFTVARDGSVDGKGTIVNTAIARHETLTDGRMVGPYLMGYWRTDEWELPIGYAAIALRLSRGGNWLEGFSTWFDHEHGGVDCSREILVRKGLPETDAMMSDARWMMAQDRQLFATRKLVESGYDFELACKMRQETEAATTDAERQNNGAAIKP